MLTSSSEQVGGSGPGRLKTGVRSENIAGRPDASSARRLLPPPALEKSVLRQLLVRPIQQTQEQGPGYWLRTAHDNGLTDPSWLLGTNKPYTQPTLRVCPLCLTQHEPLWCKTWLDRTMPICADHQVWLVDQCHACQKPLRWGRVRFLACRCGQDLRELRTRELTPDVRIALTMENVPLHVLLWLGAFERYGLNDKPLKKASRQVLSEVIELAQTGSTVVCDWPAALFRTFDRQRVDSRTASSLALLNEALPGMAKRIGKIRDAGWRAKINGALRAYVLETRHTPTPLIGRNVPGSHPPTLASLAKGVGVGPMRLASAIDQIPESGVRHRHTAGGRCRRVASPATAAAARRALDDEMGLKPAARLIGFTVTRLRRLIQEGRLSAHRGHVSRSALEELRTSLTEKISTERLPADCIPFDRALRYWIPVERTSQLLVALQSGELKLYGSPHTGAAMHVLVRESQVRAWVSMQPPADRDWLTIPECAQRLMLKQEVVYHLVNVGVMPAEVIRADRRKARVVKVGALRFFEDHIESLSRAAVRAGVDHRRGFEWAQAKGMELVSGPRIDGGRQYFVRREVLLDAEGAHPSKELTKATSGSPKRPAHLR